MQFFLAACVLFSGLASGLASGLNHPPPPGTMNPHCPKKLKDEKSRYKCYSKTLWYVIHGVETTNMEDLAGSANYFLPLMPEDVQGRAAPGKFFGLALNAEYLAIAWPAFVGPSRHALPFDMNYFLQTHYVISFNVNFLVHDLTFDVIANWSIYGWCRFDKDTNLMSKYDLDFRFYGTFLTELKVIGLPTDVAAQQSAGVASVICNVTMNLCKGNLTQYVSYDACVAYLSQRPFITPRMAIEADCLLCRYIHSILLIFDVNIHCFHVGPSGPLNGACSNFPYADEFSFFAPNTFVGKPGQMFQYPNGTYPPEKYTDF